MQAGICIMMQRLGQLALFIFGPSQLRDLDQFNVRLLGRQHKLVPDVKNLYA